MVYRFSVNRYHTLKKKSGNATCCTTFFTTGIQTAFVPLVFMKKFSKLLFSTSRASLTNSLVIHGILPSAHQAIRNKNIITQTSLGKIATIFPLSTSRASPTVPTDKGYAFPAARDKTIFNSPISTKVFYRFSLFAESATLDKRIRTLITGKTAKNKTRFVNQNVLHGCMLTALKTQGTMSIQAVFT